MQNDITSPQLLKKIWTRIRAAKTGARLLRFVRKRWGAEGKIALGIYEWEKVGVHKWRDMVPQ